MPNEQISCKSYIKRFVFPLNFAYLWISLKYKHFTCVWEGREWVLQCICSWHGKVVISRVIIRMSHWVLPS